MNITLFWYKKPPVAAAFIVSAERLQGLLLPGSTLTALFLGGTTEIVL
jgi:hypothetical protein